MKFEDGKYEVVFDENNIPREVLRYGEPWRDILGDKFLALVLCELQDFRNKGDVVITTNKDGECVCVTRQDEEHNFLEVIWEK